MKEFKFKFEINDKTMAKVDIVLSVIVMAVLIFNVFVCIYLQSVSIASYVLLAITAFLMVLTNMMDSIGELFKQKYEELKSEESNED